MLHLTIEIIRVEREEKRYIMEIKTIRGMGCLCQYQRKQALINITRDKKGTFIMTKGIMH